MLLDVRRVGLSGHALEHEAEQPVVGIRVLECGTGGMMQFHASQQPRLFGARRRLGAANQLQSRGFWQPARVIQQMPHRDARAGGAIPHAKPGEISLNGRIEPNLARFGRLHDRQRRKRFREGTENERGRGRHGAAVRIGDAEAPLVYDAVAFHDRERKARRSDPPHFANDIGVHGRKPGGAVREDNGRGESERAW